MFQNVWKCTFVTDYLQQHQVRIDHISNLNKALAAVSYTHLDVYKRQAQGPYLQPIDNRNIINFKNYKNNPI